MVGCIDDKHISTIIAPSENDGIFTFLWPWDTIKMNMFNNLQFSPLIRVKVTH